MRSVPNTALPAPLSFSEPIYSSPSASMASQKDPRHEWQGITPQRRPESTQLHAHVHPRHILSCFTNGTFPQNEMEYSMTVPVMPM